MYCICSRRVPADPEARQPVAAELLALDARSRYPSLSLSLSLSLSACVVGCSMYVVCNVVQSNMMFDMM